jgi:hypothetical protein
MIPRVLVSFPRPEPLRGSVRPPVAERSPRPDIDALQALTPLVRDLAGHLTAASVAG